MNTYILGSHNSWSYLKPKKWWMRPFAFVAKCQCKTLQEQYDLGVRCFDLRVRWRKLKLQVAHGLMVYDITKEQLLNDLDFLDKKGDCYVRILHEARNKKQYEPSKLFFKNFCYVVVADFPNIKWWCGRNLYNWEVDYDFGQEPSCEEDYSSVSKPRLLDDWWPWLYARLHNRKIRKKGTDADILLIDYVNIK